MNKNPIVFIILFIAFSLCIGSSAMAEPNNSKPKVGDTCEKTSFTNFCNGDFAMKCVRGKVKAIDCAKRTKVNEGYTCTEFVPSGKVYCTSEIDQCYVENDKIFREKQNSSGEAKTEFYRCEKTTSGKLYYRRISIDFAQEIAESQDIPINSVKNVKIGDKCKQENEIVEIEQTTKGKKVKTKLLRCEKNSKGELTYKSISRSEAVNSNNSDSRPKDSKIDLPFGTRDSNSSNKKKSRHKRIIKPTSTDGRPGDSQIDLPF